MKEKLHKNSDSLNNYRVIQESKSSLNTFKVQKENKIINAIKYKFFGTKVFVGASVFSLSMNYFGSKALEFLKFTPENSILWAALVAGSAKIFNLIDRD